MKIMAILATFFILITVFVGCEGHEKMKIGLVNMNEAGLDAINQQIVDYGKKLAEEKGFAVLQEELKKAEGEARNTLEAAELKEKIKPLLEAWENTEKIRGGGNTEEIKAVETKFQELMSSKELTDAYGKYHGIIDSDQNVIAKRKELTALNKDIGADIGKKRAGLTEDFYRKIKIISSEIVRGKYGIVLGITEFSPDGKKISQKIEILYCDKGKTEDLTDIMAGRMKFFGAD
ncbi:MAG: hypothetical protein US76_04165 [Parcubacteria group bacterium GW2011_GWA2_38_13b]|nr:MAG: hypothetical protein US76_04165 [Parcubacteria group bacterium GW2011_GWA2_38_13b]